MIYDLRRTRGIAVVSLTIAAVMLVYGVGLNAALRPHDEWLAEQRQDPGATTKFRVGSGLKRIRGLVHSIESAPLPEGKRLGLLLGPSGLWDGVDPYQLTAELGGAHLWANIHSSSYAETFLFMTRLIYANGLRPDVLIVVTNPGVIVLGDDRDEARGWYDVRPPFQHLINRQFREVPGDLLGITYTPFRLAFPYHAQINTLYERSVFVAKLRAFEAWGSGLDSLITPDPQPWQEPYLEGVGINDIILTCQERQGWFDASSYQSDGPGLKLITEVCRLAHAHRTRVFFLLLPESSIYRAKLPPGNEFPLTHTLPDLLPEASRLFLTSEAQLPTQISRMSTISILRGERN